MLYNEIELEKKRKALQNYWAFAYAEYLRKYNEQIRAKYIEAFNTLAETFSPRPKEEDIDRDRIAKAAVIVKAAEEVHNELKEINEEKKKVHEELEQLKKVDDLSARAAIIRKGIMDYCGRFTSEFDRKSVVKDAPCLLEYLDAVFESPELAAKVGLNDKQYTLASKIVSMGMIIKEGMECLEAEYADAASPRHEIDEKQHAINLAKITMMDFINEKRLKDGSLIKELQKCDLLTEYANADRFELAAKMADPKNRTAITKKITASAEGKMVKQDTTEKPSVPKSSGPKQEETLKQPVKTIVKTPKK